MNMEKSKQTLKALIVGLVLLLLGISMIVVGVILNNYLKTIATDAGEKYSPAWFIYLLEIGGALFFLASFGNLYYYMSHRFNFKKMNVKQMGVIAVFAALSVILYYFGKFNLPFFPSWLDVQFSDVPAILVSFMYGPLSGVITIFVRFFCKLPGTMTVGVGELADLLIGLAMVIPTGLFYKKHRTLKGAFISIGIGMASGTFVGVVANWLILIPAYINLAHFPMAALVKTMDGIISGGNGVVVESNFMVYYLFVGVLPFNLFRYTLVFAITLILYKRLHQLVVYYAGSFNSKDEVNVEELEDLQEE